VDEMTSEMIQVGSGAAVPMLPAYAQIDQTIKACTDIGAALKTTFNLTSPHHGTVMMLTCMSEGLSVSDYNKRYHGDGTMRASAIQAEFMNRGGVIDWQELGDDGKLASAKFSHPKLMSEPRLITYTIEDARRQVGDKMEKPGSNWKTNPGAMLRAALVRKAVKIIDPGVVTGYDSFNDLDYSPPATPSAAVVGHDQAAVDARRAELLQQMNTTADTSESDVIDVVAEPVVEVAAETTEQAAETPTEEPPFKTEGAAEADPAGACTNDQLQELVNLGQKFPSPQNSGQNMTLEEISSGLCEAAGVDDPTLMTYQQASDLIDRFREQLSKL